MKLFIFASKMQKIKKLSKKAKRRYKTKLDLFNKKKKQQEKKNERYTNI